MKALFAASAVVLLLASPAGARHDRSDEIQAPDHAGQIQAPAHADEIQAP